MSVRLCSFAKASAMTGIPELTTCAVAVDVALVTVVDDTFRMLVVEPEAAGYEGTWSLPGGRVLDDENLDDAARRILHDAAGVAAPAHLEQLRTYGEPNRDARARVVSVAYLAFTPAPALPDTPRGHRAEYVDVASLIDGALGELAFDHGRVIPDAVERARAKLEYAPLALAFVAEPFTIADVRGVYEAVWGEQLDTANFRRKVTTTPGFVVPTDERSTSGPGGGRPARLYRRGAAATLHPAMLRAGQDLG